MVEGAAAPVGSEGLRLGPVLGSDDRRLADEERSLLATFSARHLLPLSDVRVASLLDAEGSRVGVVVVVDLRDLREIARRSGKLSRIDPPVFERDARGLPAAATVRVHRSDLARGVARTAFWHERAPFDRNVEEVPRWVQEPDSVMAEIAEALALRGALPQLLEGVYTDLDLDEAVREFELRKVAAHQDLRGRLEALR